MGRPWSALECGHHVCDVLIAHSERILLALVEDRHRLALIHREQRAAQARDAASHPAQVVAQVNVVAVPEAHTCDGMDQAAWRRECIDDSPAPQKHGATGAGRSPPTKAIATFWTSMVSCCRSATRLRSCSGIPLRAAGHRHRGRYPSRRCSLRTPTASAGSSWIRERTR